MNKETFNKDYEDYKSKLSEKLDEEKVNLMMHAFCMGYCQLSNELNEEFDSYIDLNPVFDRINELSPKVSKSFK